MMKVISIMTLVILPTTFWSTVFGAPVLDWNAPLDEDIIRPRFKTWLALVLSTTICVVVL
jgi:hypothetical protein